jgi:hypothetical protein
VNNKGKNWQLRKQYAIKYMLNKKQIIPICMNWKVNHVMKYSRGEGTSRYPGRW